jgi:hypothetical protein
MNLLTPDEFAHIERLPADLLTVSNPQEETALLQLHAVLQPHKCGNKIWPPVATAVVATNGAHLNVETQ